MFFFPEHVSQRWQFLFYFTVQCQGKCLALMVFIDLFRFCEPFYFSFYFFVFLYSDQKIKVSYTSLNWKLTLQNSLRSKNSLTFFRDILHFTKLIDKFVMTYMIGVGLYQTKNVMLKLIAENSQPYFFLDHCNRIHYLIISRKQILLKLYFFNLRGFNSNVFLTCGSQKRPTLLCFGSFSHDNKIHHLIITRKEILLTLYFFFFFYLKGLLILVSS